MKPAITTLEGQQAELIARLPEIMGFVRRHMDGDMGGTIFRTLAERIASGHRVFGHNMFTWDAGELLEEFEEEFADALAYLLAYLWVSDHGSLPKHDLLPGQTVRIKEGSLGAGRIGIIHKIGESGSTCSVRIDEASHLIVDADQVERVEA